MRSRRLERGAALVEASLVLLVFWVTLLEILEIGQFIFFQAMLMDRARAAARCAQVSTFNSTNITNVVVYNNPGRGLFGLTTSMVSVNRYDAGLLTDRIEIVIRNFPLAFYGAYAGRELLLQIISRRSSLLGPRRT